MKRIILTEIHPFILLIGFFFLPVSCTMETTEQKNLKVAESNVKWGKPSSEAEYGFNNFFDYVYAEYYEPVDIDLQEIKERGKLIALTGYSPTGYFVYKGTPMGFEHDMLQLLAKELNVELEIVIVNDMNEIFDMLNRGEGDLIADNLTITKERDALVDFTVPLHTTKQVLVQRKPSNWEKMTPELLEAKLIRKQTDLIGKPVHVRRESAFYARLKNLSDEMGGDIKIMEEPGDSETEELIARVSKGEIPFTVADENTAKLHAVYYPEIDIKTPISFEQRIGWAVRETSPELLAVINTWLTRITKQASYKTIYAKYFTKRSSVEQMVKCSRIAMCGRNISPYDQLIIAHAKRIGWDWRLLASLIYQESQFNPKAKSWAGACGLMQLMPATAESFGAKNPEDPKECIKAGTDYLKWLEKYWEKKVPDKNERLKFIMASYNVGQEHVADAQRLAVKYKKDPKVWDDNVAYFILQKSKQKYCTDPVVKYGYCRGREPFDYVNNILARYEHYKKLIKAEV